MSKPLSLVASLALSSLAVLSGFEPIPAQEMPAREEIVPPRPDRDNLEPLRERPEATPPAQPLTPTVPGTLDPSQLPNLQLTVAEFAFVGNTIFSTEELSAVADPFKDRPLSASELLQVAANVARLYTEAGYTTSGAIVELPREPQTGATTVTVRVIEGELEAIELFPQGRSRLRKGYVRSRLQLGSKRPLNINRLQERLQLLQLDPRIAAIAATLTSGSEPGKSILQVEYREAQAFKPALELDNGRSPSVGTFRQTADLRHLNLSGLGDEAAIGYARTDGSDRFDASYAVPVNARDGSLGFVFSFSDNRVVESPFDDIDRDGRSPDIESEFETYELAFRQPVLRRIRNQTYQEIALSFGGFWSESQTFLLDEPFPLALGAEIDGETRIFALRFGQEYIRRNNKAVFALQSQLNFGLDAFNATINEPIAGVEPLPDSEFFAWRGQAQWAYLLGRNSLVLLRSNIQIADGPLVSSEQFGLGGAGSVRGFRQDRLLADNGVFGSAEVQLPILQAFGGDGVLQVVPFFDVGTVWNNEGRFDPDPETLVATGFGLQFQFRDDIFARIDWGIPLTDADSQDGTLQEDGILFSLRISPF